MLTEREVLFDYQYASQRASRCAHGDARHQSLTARATISTVFELKVRSKILKYAKRLVETCNGVGDRYGIPVVNKRIAVSAIGTVCAGFSTVDGARLPHPRRMRQRSRRGLRRRLRRTGGKRHDAGRARNLINALPEALATTDRICSSINVGSTKSGINMDAVSLMGQNRGNGQCNGRPRRQRLRLVVFCNIPQDVPFMAGAYLGVGEPDVVIDVGVSGPGVVNKALQRAIEESGRKLTLSETPKSSSTPPTK